MNDNELFETRVDKYSTCLSYALDRVGLSDSYKFIKEIPESKFKPFNALTVKVGDIVAWKNKAPIKLYFTSIVSFQKYPIPIQNLEDCSYHLGVVEKIITPTNTIIISDCTRSMNPNYHPEIRLQILSLTKLEDNEFKLPEFIIKL